MERFPCGILMFAEVWAVGCVFGIVSQRRRGMMLLSFILHDLEHPKPEEL